MTPFDDRLPHDIGTPHDSERARVIAGVSVAGALMLITAGLLVVAVLIH